jgi:hypothetical protein
MSKGRTDILPMISVEPTVIVYGLPKVKKPVHEWCMNVSDFPFNVEDMREWLNYCNDTRTYLNPQVKVHPASRQQALMTLQTTYWAMITAMVYHDLLQGGKPQDEALDIAETVQAVGMTKDQAETLQQLLALKNQFRLTFGR